jgi:hypothetical protein
MGMALRIAGDADQFRECAIRAFEQNFSGSFERNQ